MMGVNIVEEDCWPTVEVMENIYFILRFVEQKKKPYIIDLFTCSAFQFLGN